MLNPASRRNSAVHVLNYMVRQSPEIVTTNRCPMIGHATRVVSEINITMTYVRHTTAIILLIASTLPGRSQTMTDLSCEEAVRHIVSEWIEGYNLGDASRVARLYAEDAYYLTQHFPTGIVHGRAAIQSYVQRGAHADYQIDSIETLHVDCTDEFAYAITRYHSTNAGRKVFGVNVVVLKRLNGTWMIVAHEAAVPDSAAIKNPDIPEVH